MPVKKLPGPASPPAIYSLLSNTVAALSARCRNVFALLSQVPPVVVDDGFAQVTTACACTVPFDHSAMPTIKTRRIRFTLRIYHPLSCGSHSTRCLNVSGDFPGFYSNGMKQTNSSVLKATKIQAGCRGGFATGQRVAIIVEQSIFVGQ